MLGYLPLNLPERHFARLGFLAVMVMTVPGIAPRAGAATITVTTAADELNSDGDGALREAVRAANTNLAVDACTAGSNTETDTIVVPAGTYTLTIVGDVNNGALGGDLDLVDNAADPDLIITGAGAASTIVQACPVDQKTAACPAGQGVAERVFHVISAQVSISGITIRHGRDQVGGGIYNTFLQGVGTSSVVTLTDCIVTDNAISSVGDAGGIYTVDGTVNLVRKRSVSRTLRRSPTSRAVFSGRRPAARTRCWSIRCRDSRSC